MLSTFEKIPGDSLVDVQVHGRPLEKTQAESRGSWESPQVRDGKAKALVGGVKLPRDPGTQTGSVRWDSRLSFSNTALKGPSPSSAFHHCNSACLRFCCQMKDTCSSCSLAPRYRTQQPHSHRFQQGTGRCPGTPTRNREVPWCSNKEPGGALALLCDTPPFLPK